MHSDNVKPMVCLVLIAVVTISSATMLSAATEPGGETPEAVFERLRQAAANEDLREMASCIAPQSRAEISAMMIAFGGMVVAFSQMGSEMAAEMGEADQAEEAAAEVGELQSRFEQMLARHGLDQSAFEEGPGEETSEMPAELESVDLFADVMAFMEELPSEGEGGSDEGFAIPEGELTDLQIDGDVATATIGDEPGTFVRIDGRWYVDLDSGMGEMEP